MSNNYQRTKKATRKDTINTLGNEDKVKYRTITLKRGKANNRRYKEIPVFNTFTASVFTKKLIVARCLMLVILRGKTANQMMES